MGSFSVEALKEKVEETKELSTLPSVILRILEVVNNPMADARDVEKEVMEDPAITAKILRVANSPYYGANRDISSISQAVVLMGFAEVQNIALSVSVFSRFAVPTKMFDRREFWEHCFSVAAIADALQHRADEYVNDGFSTGLLHDVGRIVLDQHFPNEFKQIVKEAETRQISLLEAEQDVIGATHCDVGYWIAEKWNLPTILAEGILYHHSPLDCERSQLLPAIVHVADAIAKGFGEYVKHVSVPTPKDPEAFRLLGLDVDNAADVAELITKKMGYLGMLLEPDV